MHRCDMIPNDYIPAIDIEQVHLLNIMCYYGSLRGRSNPKVGVILEKAGGDSRSPLF